MLINYFKTGWRYIRKRPFFPTVNVFGLAMGLAFTFLTAGFILNEWRVNKDLKNIDQQYIIQSKWKNRGDGNEFTTIGMLPKALYEHYPTLVANYYRVDGVTSTVTKDNNSFRETIAICDTSLLKMYGFKLLHGNPATAMRDPFTVLITEKQSLKYFGKTDVTGQMLTIENFSGDKHDFQISGVIKTYNRNTVTGSNPMQPYEYFIPEINHAFFNRSMTWQDTHMLGFIEAQPGVSKAQIEKAMAQLVKQNAPPETAAAMTPFLAPLKSFYLKSNNRLAEKMIYALTGISIFILFMAVINFINISISRSASRMREIGVRKVLGGLRRQLTFQFLTESVIIVFIATVSALIIYSLARNSFSNLLGRQIPALTDYPVWFLIIPFLIILVVGILSGLYPALVLSSFRPAASLKGKGSSYREKDWLRKGLVAFQFGTAITVIIGAVIISKQVNLFLSKDLGFNKEFILTAQAPRNWSAEGVEKMLANRKRFESLPFVKEASLSYEIPNGNNAGKIFIYHQDREKTVAMQYLQADENFPQVYEIGMAAGDFLQGDGKDVGKVVLNETAVKAMGMSSAAEAVGKILRAEGDTSTYQIAGVTKDFHFGSMQNKIMPVFFVHVQRSNMYRYLSFKLAPGNVSSSVQKLESEWKKILPGAPFEFRFMDDVLKAMYQTEIQLKKAAYTATVLALIIVLLGVIGLVSLSIQKRTKEIGIRKVLGSSVISIIMLFIKDFFWILFAGAAVAIPISYYLMHNWLQDYEYRIGISALPFLVSIAGVAVITALLIGFQTLKAASVNPVKSLASE